MVRIKKEDPESFMKSRWRPAMAWMYMGVILFDFVAAPIFWAVVQSDGGIVSQQWEPLTLGAGGLFHLSMGAILGATAWSRGKEKMAGVAGDYYPLPTSYQREYQQQVPHNPNEEI